VRENVQYLIEQLEAGHSEAPSGTKCLPSRPYRGGFSHMRLVLAHFCAE
jgi:hypothetical protein